jgi:pimeloyl-ACP methyl ester carboxylesterase
VHFAHSAAGRWPGASVQARILGRATQLAVENGAVDRYFAREAGSREAGSASYRLIRTGFGERPDPAQVLFVRDMAASVPPSVRADTFRAMTGFDLRPRLGEIATPVLLVVGGHDRLVNPGEAKDLAPAFPNARVEEFPQAGHALFLEEHDRFTGLVREFAAKRLGARRPAGVRTSTRAPARVPPQRAGQNGARARRQSGS